MSEKIQVVTVYCASSRQVDAAYRDAAYAVGEQFAAAGITLVYGGGAVGSMGAVADGALARGGRVEGVLPRFMFDLEWAHRNITDLHVVSDMHERKRLMLERADAVVALPGGCGTLEEVFEAITWKRLGLFVAPIVLVNTRGYWNDCVRFLDHVVDECFMDQRHRQMWTVVSEPADVLAAIASAPPWSDEARDFAVP